MTYRLCIHGEELSEAEAQTVLAGSGGKLERRDGKAIVVLEHPLDGPKIAELGHRLGRDINPLPRNFDPARVQLVVSDMDSTLVDIECIDEIADMAGVKPQVAAITEAAMRGEIDFEEALRQRVAALKDLPVEVLEQVYHDRLGLNPGVDRLIEFLNRRGIKMALVSGGFTFFTERLQKHLGLYASRANVLDIDDGKLTGGIRGKIVDAEEKARFLLQTCAGLAIEPTQAIALGDGANDLKMMSVAGLSVAYRGKQAVRDYADVCLNFSGLDGVCDVFWDSDGMMGERG